MCFALQQKRIFFHPTQLATSKLLKLSYVNLLLAHIPKVRLYDNYVKICIIIQFMKRTADVVIYVEKTFNNIIRLRR